MKKPDLLILLNRTENLYQIQPYAQGLKISLSWRVDHKKVKPGMTVGFVDKWSDTHTYEQGEIVDMQQQPSGRWGIVFRPMQQPVDLTKLNISNKHTEKNYF